MANQYTRKPVIVEAVQWTGKNASEVKAFCGYADAHMLVEGTYIVKEENGKFNLYSQSAFNEVFQKHLVWEENI